MRNLFPAASACFVVVLIASVGYAESQNEAANLPVSNEVAQDESTSDEVTLQQEALNTAAAELSEMTESDSSKSTAPRELSTAPLTHIRYPDDRPSWISQEPDLQSAEHTWVVTTGGCDSIQMCEDKLGALKPAAVALYVKRTTGWECDDALLDEQWIEDELVSRRYLGTLQQGDQTLHEIAVELKFDGQARERIDLAHEQARRERVNSIVGERLQATAGLFTLAVLGLFCTGGLLGLVSRRFS